MPCRLRDCHRCLTSASVAVGELARIPAPSADAAAIAVSAGQFCRAECRRAVTILLFLRQNSCGSPDVIACIGGRGFRIRREDMKKLLLSTRGRVFTLQNLDRLVDHTRLAKFRAEDGA